MNTDFEFYKKTITDVIGKDDYKRLGTTFETKKNKYVYDSGTGKIFVCESEAEYLVFKTLFETSDFDEVEGIQGITKEQLFTALQNISIMIENEYILQAPRYTHFETDTREEIEAIMNNGMKQIILEVTESCNLRCKYCIYSEHNDVYREFTGNNMDWETAKAALDFAGNHSGENLAVTFYGGEPLLRFDLIKQCIEYCKEMYGDKKKIIFSLTSNMTLMNKEIAEYLSSVENLSIMCSLDGPKDIQDRYRVTKDGTGSFDKAVTGIELLVDAMGKEKAKNISVNVVLTPPFKKDKFKKIKDFFINSDWFIDDIVIRCTYVESGSLRREDMETEPLCVTAEEFFENNRNEIIDPFNSWVTDNICEGNYSNFEKYVMDSNLIGIHKRPISKKPMTWMRRGGCCIPGTRRLYVTTQGEFKLCEKMGISPSIGNIRSGIDIDAIMNNYITAYDKTSLQQCNDCWANHICSLCYVGFYDSEGINAEKKEHMCSVIRRTTKVELEHYHELYENNPDSILHLNEITIE